MLTRLVADIGGPVESVISSRAGLGSEGSTPLDGAGLSQEAGAADQRASNARRRALRSDHVNWALCLAAVLAATGGRTGSWCSIAVLLLARRISDRSNSVLSNMPTAALVVATFLVAVLTVADLLGLTLLASTTQSRALLLVTTLVGVAAVLLGGRPSAAPLANKRELLACAPASGLLLVAVWLSQQPTAFALSSFLLSWDNGAHVLSSSAIGRSGTLSYSDDGYPRGLHALVALHVTSTGPVAVTPPLLERFLLTQSFLTWVLFTFLSATVGLVTLRLLDHRRSMPSTAVGAAGFVAGLAVLTPSFLGFTMVFGFETTIAVGFVLAVVSLELLRERHPLRESLMATAAFVATAHTYQLALPVVAVPLLAAGLRLVLVRPAHWAVGMGACLLLLSTAIPPALSVLRTIGVGAVGTHGELAPLPQALLVTGLASTLWLLATSRRASALVFAVMALTFVASALAMAAVGDTDLDDYYPTKMLWHAALLTLPLLASIGAQMLHTWARFTRSIPFVRLTSVSVALCAALLVGAAAIHGTYLAVTTGIPGDPLAAVLHPEDEAAACMLESGHARKVAVRLLYFYRADPTPPPPHIGELPPCPAGPRQP